MNLMAQATCIALKFGAYLQHNLQIMQHFLITSPFFGNLITPQKEKLQPVLDPHN